MPGHALFGSPSEQSQIDQWLDFITQNSPLLASADAFAVFDMHLKTRSFLAGTPQLSLADVALWAGMESAGISGEELAAHYPHLARWHAGLGGDRGIRTAKGKVMSMITLAERQDKAATKAKEAEAAAKAAAKKEKGKGKGKGKGKVMASAATGGGVMDDLKNVKDPKKVVTRFPPEPSGYMHIGHVKASLINYFYAKEKYQGKMILRFDDTNPNNEKGEYVKSITEDLARLGVKPDMLTHTSDHFDRIAEYATKAIEDGFAYMDPT